MTHYIFIENGKIIGKGCCKCLDVNILNIEVAKDVFDNIEKYIFENGNVVLNPNYEAEQAAFERARLDTLSLTAADVERAIYKAKGMDFDDIIEHLKTLKQVQGDGLDIDLKALKIELKANNFYRGNPYINQIGSILGFSESQLDNFFETRDYRALMEKVEEENA